MPRTASRRPLPLRLATLGPGLLAISLAAGCADDTPRAASADLGASRKAVAPRGARGPGLGPRGADVAPTRTRGRGMGGLPAGPGVKTPGTSR